MTSGAEGSSASANAGKMSVIKLSQRICSATSGKGQPIIRAIKTVRISERLQDANFMQIISVNRPSLNRQGERPLSLCYDWQV
jgi:hypothetical protein